jgi:hypothetical protein
MAVFRVNKTGDYTVISNTHFKEKEMSLKAKGLLSLMLSLPDTWDYSVNGLASLSKDGKDSVMNALTELENFGYLKRTKNVDAQGRFAGYDYDIFEKPQTENPYTENPNTDKPNTENPPQLNTKQSSTKKPNTKKSITKRKPFVPPTLEEVDAYCKERKNNVDPKKFFDYFNASDWVDSNGKDVRNWKQKVITWENYAKPKETNTNEGTSGVAERERIGNYI